MSFATDPPGAAMPTLHDGSSTPAAAADDLAANLPSNVAHWLASADDDDAPKPTAVPSTELFNGDSGTLKLDTRRCLVSLLNGPSIDGRRQAGLWTVLLRDQDVVRSYLHNIFLDLVVDVAQQVAFIRQVPDEGETSIPILLRRHQLTLIESALVLFLRQRLTEADSANERAVVSIAEMVEHLTLFEQARNTDLSGFERQCQGAIKKCKQLNFMRPIRASDGRYEVSPTLKLLFNAEDIQALTATYEALKNEPPEGGLTMEAAIARGIADGELENETDLEMDED